MRQQNRSSGMNFKNRENMFANWETGRSKSKPGELEGLQKHGREFPDACCTQRTES